MLAETWSRRCRATRASQLYYNATLKQVDGFVGNFRSDGRKSPATAAARQEVIIEHGVIIVATGAEERKTTAYLYGQDPRVVTQRELEEALAEGSFAFPEGQRGTW